MSTTTTTTKPVLLKPMLDDDGDELRGVFVGRIFGGNRPDGGRYSAQAIFRGDRRTAQREANAWAELERKAWRDGKRRAELELTLGAYWQRRIDAGTWANPRTLEDKCTQLKLAQGDGFADLPLDAIDAAAVAAHLAWLGTRPKDKGTGCLSPSTLRGHLGAIRNMLHAAVRDGLLESFPNLSLVKAPKVKPRTRRKLPSSHVVLEHLGATRKVAHNNAGTIEREWPRWFVLAVQLELATGLRVGELLGLMYGDVEYLLDGSARLRVERQVKARTATQAKQGVPKVIVEPTLKTDNSERLVLIGADVVALIEHYALEVEQRAADAGLEVGGEDWPTNPDRFIFSTDWIVPLVPTQVGHLWTKLRRECDLPGDFRFHDLRHLHATSLLGAGMTIPDVAARLGNTTKTTMQAYLHPTDVGEAAAAKAASAMLFGHATRLRGASR